MNISLRIVAFPKEIRSRNFLNIKKKQLHRNIQSGVLFETWNVEPNKVAMFVFFNAIYHKKT